MNIFIRVCLYLLCEFVPSIVEKLREQLIQQYPAVEYVFTVNNAADFFGLGNLLLGDTALIRAMQCKSTFEDIGKDAALLTLLLFFISFLTVCCSCCGSNSEKYIQTQPLPQKSNSDSESSSDSDTSSSDDEDHDILPEEPADWSDRHPIASGLFGGAILMGAGTIVGAVALSVYRKA